MTGSREVRARVAYAVGVAGAHPRHVVLAALVGGLLAGPRAPGPVAVVVAAALVAALVAERAAGSPDMLLAGVALGAVAGAAVAEERLRALDRTALRPAAVAHLRGFVVDPVRTRSSGVRVAVVRLTAGPGAGERVLLRARPYVGWPRAGVGDEVRARGRLRALAPHERFERRRHVHAVLEVERLAATGRTRGSPVDAIRRRAERALAAGLPPEQSALARGMVLGQDHALPEDLRDAFRASGLGHLLAASGQNVALLAALVVALATLAGLDLRPRLCLALESVALYVPLAGAGPSIQRAGVMGAAALVAALAGRPASRWYALLLAAAATLVANPRAAEEPGWQLSFAAVVAILALHRRLRDALVARRAPAALAEAGALTIAATLGTAPLVAAHFEQVSVVSLPANVVAAVAVAPVMWLGALAAAAGGDVAHALNALAAYPLAFLAQLARAAAGVPHATVALGVPGPLAVVAAYVGMAAAAAGAAAAWRRSASWRSAVDADLRGRRGATPWWLGGSPGARLAGVAAVGCAAVALLWPRPPAPPAGFALSFLDVGQGDATLVQHGSRAILVDTGPPGAPLLKRLREAGVDRLDAVLVTHSSADHEGNLAELLRALPVDVVLDGRQRHAERAAESGGEGGGWRFAGLPPRVARAVPTAGHAIRAGPLELRILWPPPDLPRAGDPNATATVALVRDGAFTALLTADAESPVTLPLDVPRVDVLKVAHHGSEDPGLPALLERARPRVAVIPVGRNTYGHPHPATLAALRGVPTVRRTDRDGTVRVTVSRGRLRVDPPP